MAEKEAILSIKENKTLISQITCSVFMQESVTTCGARIVSVHCWRDSHKAHHCSGLTLASFLLPSFYAARLAPCSSENPLGKPWPESFAPAATAASKLPLLLCHLILMSFLSPC